MGMITLNEKELKLDCSNCGNDLSGRFAWESDSSIINSEDPNLIGVNLIQDFKIRCLECREVMLITAKSAIKDEIVFKLIQAAPEINRRIQETKDRNVNWIPNR